MQKQKRTGAKANNSNQRSGFNEAIDKLFFLNTAASINMQISRVFLSAYATEQLDGLLSEEKHQLACTFEALQELIIEIELAKNAMAA